MAAKEIYDYVDIAVADKNVTLSVSPQAVISELGHKNVVIHKGVDGSESRINFSGTKVEPFIGLKWNVLKSESDAGTVMQFWYDTDYGNGMTYSFKFSSPDEHTYVVRFDCDFERLTHPRHYGIPIIRLKVFGKIAD